MKMSKSARLRYWTGLGLFFGGAVAFYLVAWFHGECDLTLVLLGSFGLCIMWILAIQHDLYGSEEK